MAHILFALLLFLLTPFAAAQTWTSCNPLNSTCPPNAALSTNHTFDFTASVAGKTWNTTAGKIDYDPQTGASFTITRKGDAPTMQSKFHLFFGQVEVWMKAASGKGVISSIVLQSDDLDEIDWEIIGSNTSHLENNYYGKGNTTDAVSRAKWYTIPNDISPQDDFHNYTIEWTKEKLDWYIDGTLIRTLKYEEANGGESYPQTPCNVRIGIWAGGDKANAKDTIEWAGGEIDYKEAPYTMSVKSARVKDFSEGKEYKYGDNSGKWESIEVVKGDSSAQEELDKPPAMSVKQRWGGLSTNAKIGIAAGAVGFAAAAVLLLAFCCIKQRKAGRKEAALANAQYEQDTAELMQYRAHGLRGREKI